MTEPNQKSNIRNQKSQISRFVLIVLVAAFVLVVGHYGFRAFHEPADAGVSGPMLFGRSAARDAAAVEPRQPATARPVAVAGARPARDVPRPPRSEPGFAMPSPGGPGRILAAYASQAAPEEVIRFYRTEMPCLGWTERKPEGVTFAREGFTTLLYSNAAGDSCIISVSTRPAAQTAVTVLRMTPSGGK
jgi:hypothetical protein